MIIVAGATGYTGTLISHELSNSGHPPILAGRDQGKLDQLARAVTDDGIRDGTTNRRGDSVSTRVLDVTDPGSISNALADAKVVINCAGPFMDLGEGVLSEAAQRGIHYLDTTGEQPFIRMAYEKYGPMAAASGTSVIPGCAFEYTLGDAAAALAARSIEPCQRIELIYWMAGFGSSRGTKKSVLRMLGETAYQRQGGQFVESVFGAKRLPFNVQGRGVMNAYLMPGGEVVMAPLHTHVEDVETFMALPTAPTILKASMGLVPLLKWSPVARLISRAVDRGQFGPSLEERKKSEFLITCKATGNKGSRTVTVQGADPYGLTALIAARIAVLIDSGQAKPAGATSPSMVAGHQTIIDLTSEAGVNWSVSSDSD